MSIRSLISGKRARILAAAAVAAAFASVPAVSPRLLAQAKQPIQVFLSATDAVGKPVADLKAEDVSILVNGTACETTKFETINWPVKLQLIVDNGPVHQDSMRQLKEALRAFVAELPADMEVSIISTDPQPVFVFKPSTDKAKLLSAVDIIIPDKGAPRFIDALTEAVDRINKDKTDKKNPEKGNYFPVMMMIASNGNEGSGVQSYQLGKTMKQVTDNAPIIHIVLQSAKLSDAVAGANLVDIATRLTKMTGGRLAGVNIETQFPTLLPEFAKQIAATHVRQSHQYRVTCQPSGAPMEITATVKRPSVTATLTLDGRLP